jgi:menaquinone-specific isochorismate synthase
MNTFIKTFLETGTLMTTGPKHVLVGYGPRTWLNAPPSIPSQQQPSQPTQPYFYSSDFFLQAAHPWFTHEFSHEIEINQLIQELSTFFDSSEPLLQTINWTSPDYTHFQKAFSNLQTRFVSKELQKAVPYVFEKTSQKVTSPLLMRSLISLLKQSLSRPMYLYGFWEKSQGILGGSPEILFSLEKEDRLLLKTMACAGTRKSADQDRLPKLLDDPKERHEHQLVVEGITQSLTPFGKVTAGETGLLQYPSLLHLVTSIQVELPSFEETVICSQKFETFVRALHPTPALGAFPKEAGQKWLVNYQTLMNRQRYGAPIGYIKADGGNATCFVAIRNMQWNEQGIMLGAGCGVVPDSNLEREWQEINAKLNAIKTILALND